MKLLSGALDGPTLTRFVGELKKAQPHAIRDLLRRMPASNSKAILRNLLPRDYQLLGRAGHGPFGGDLESEAAWTAALVSRHADPVSAFVAARTEIERALISGQYASALAALETLERRAGVSLWSLRLRLAAAERQGGLAANRELLKRVIDTSTSGVLDILAETFSRASELAGTLASYTSDLELMLQKATEQGKFRTVGSHLRFKLALHAFADFDELPRVLLRDGSFSLLDKYDTFVTVLQLSLASGAALSEPTRRALQYAFEAVRDPRLSNLQRVSNPSAPLVQTPETSALVEVSDRYTVGDYESGAELALSRLRERAECFEYYVLYLKSLIYLGRPFSSPFPDDSPAAKLARDVYDVLTKNERTPDALDSIGRLAVLLSGAPLGAQALAFCAANSRRSKRQIDANVFAALNATAPSAAFSRAYPARADALTYIRALRAAYPGSTSAELFEAALSGGTVPPNVSAERRRRYVGTERLNAGDPAGAVLELGPLASPEVPVPAREEALRAMVAAYASLHQYTPAATLIAEAHAERPQLLATIDVAPIASGYSDVPVAERGSLAWPTVCQLRLRDAPTAENKRALFAALDEFLVSHGISRPSELLPHGDRFAQRQFIHFLRHVCVPEVMDSLVGLSTVEELQAERILLCQHLMEALDPDNEPAYAGEIRRLTQAAAVRKAIRYVDESKVNIDTRGIARSLDPSFEERFARMVAFAKLMPDLRRRMEVRGVKEAADQDLIVVTVDQAAHISDLFSDIKSRFISSNEYGLDTYLSVRIRHGTLSGQLRSGFERDHLITRKGSGDIYERNDVWIERLFGPLGTATAQAADERLRAFSRDVDEIIDEVKTKWIQIKGLGPGGAGLFDFDYSQAQILSIYSTLANVTDYEEFLSRVFAELWSRTEHNLAIVVDRLRGELAQRFTTALDEMAADLYRLHEEVRHSEFGAAVSRARTFIQHAIDVVAGWFRRGSRSEFPDFGMRLLAETSVAIVQNCYRARLLDASVVVAGDFTFRGELFPPLADLMFILLENVVRHGASASPVATVELSARPGGITMRVWNPLPPDSPFEDLRLRVSQVQDLGTAALSGDVRREGGTGFRKLHRILRVDLARDADVEVRTNVVESPPGFEVTVAFPTDGLGR